MVVATEDHFFQAIDVLPGNVIIYQENIKVMVAIIGKYRTQHGGSIWEKTLITGASNVDG